MSTVEPEEARATPPPDDLAERIAKGTVIAAVYFGVFLWCTVALAVWVAMVARFVITFGARAAYNAARAVDMPDMSRLRYAVEWWPRGLRDILGILSGAKRPIDVVSDIHPWYPVQETLLALITYVGMLILPALAFGFANGLLSLIF